MPGNPPPPRDCSPPSDPTCPSLGLPIFSGSASDPITVSLFLLILSLPLQLSLPGCVPLHLFLCVSLRSSLLPSTLLYIAVPLFTNASLSVTVFLPPPIPRFYSYSLPCCPWGSAAVKRDSLGTPRGTAQGPLPGHLHTPITLARAPSSLCSSAAWRGRQGWKTQCPASAREPRGP